MILTIGMIVKNEEKNLRSCLDAIKPILQQVDSELIISDTGSTDSTVEIAKEYTDKVFPFEWCNDFSAARNSTLERAAGKWYMALDADEIFEDVSDIIQFFNSGDYKNFNSATYIIRNYNTEDRSTYSSFDAFRLTKILKDTRYTRLIHESFPRYAPTKRLTSLANHLGYLSQNNQEFIESKSQRNLDLLFLELEKEPQNCTYLYEIGQSYFMKGNLETALEFYFKGLEIAVKQKHSLRNAFYGDIARVYYVLQRLPEVLNTVHEYFASKKTKSEIDVQMYFLEASSYARLKKYKEAIEGYQKYVEFFEAYQKGTFHTDDSTLYVVNFIDQFNFQIACMNAVRAGILEKDFLSAEKFLKRIPVSAWEEEGKNVGQRLALEINLMEESSDYSRLPDLFRELNDDSLQLLATMLEPLFDNEYKATQILTVISGSDLPETDYIRLLKLRYSFFCKHTIAKQDVESLLIEIREWTPLYADLIYFALFCNLEVKFIASIVNSYDLAPLLFQSKFLHFADLPQLICKTFGYEHDDSDTNSQLWLSFLYMWALTSNQLTAENTIHLFGGYTRAINLYLTRMYKEDQLKEESLCLFPKYLRIGFYLIQAADSLAQGEKSKYIDFLKSTLRIFPEFNHVIQVLLDDLQKNLDADKSKPALSEFEKYAIVVKENINKLIAAGQLDQADQLLNSYLQLCPDDPEIVLIKKRLEASKK